MWWLQHQVTTKSDNQKLPNFCGRKLWENDGGQKLRKTRVHWVRPQIYFFVREWICPFTRYTTIVQPKQKLNFHYKYLRVRPGFGDDTTAWHHSWQHRQIRRKFPDFLAAKQKKMKTGKNCLILRVPVGPLGVLSSW